jgi:hypothetical protein
MELSYMKAKKQNRTPTLISINDLKNNKNKKFTSIGIKRTQQLHD